ncbi:hypothetical protein [Haliscomenobacter sp.]|uniref:hypothetical protein n=1 Tax=Haliscomenobacter sp. TaxID=2717303 RepID=UPI0035943AEC
MTIDARKLHLIKRLLDIENEAILDKLEAIVDADPLDLLLAEVERINNRDTADFLSFARTHELADHLGVKP